MNRVILVMGDSPVTVTAKAESWAARLDTNAETPRIGMRGSAATRCTSTMDLIVWDQRGS